MWNNHTRVHMVDFPGFDSTFYKGSTDILRDIACWMGDSYAHNIRLSRIIYLHRIMDRLVAGTVGVSNVFKALCGARNFQAVTLMTTFWAEVDPAMGTAREKGLLGQYP
jgi:hypothetical protein